MTFTYVLTTDIGQIRLQIGDTTSGKGVRPSGANLSDEEIQVILDVEGTIMRTAAGCCEMLARDWSKVAVLGAGNAKEQMAAMADEFLKQAKYLRGIYGYGGIEAIDSFNLSALRRDGYSERAGGVVSPDGDLT